MGTGATISIFGPFFPQQGTDFASSKRICMPFAIFRASVLNFTLESLVPNIRISRSNGSWLFNRACNTGSRFTESMSGSSYTQVLPLKPSSMTRYSAPNAFCNRQVQRSSSLYLLPWSALSDGSVQSPWVLESPMHKICFFTV